MTKTLKPLSQEAPPPVSRKGRRRGSKYDPIIEELKTNPGTSFKVLEDVTTSTARVFVEAGCGYTTRKNEDSTKPNRVDIWAWFPATPVPGSEEAVKTPKATAKKAPVARKRPAAKKK